MARLKGVPWQIWFEAAGLWQTRGVTQPYRDASRVVRGDTRPLGADIAVVDPQGSRALMIECKYSDQASTVGRAGCHASTYLAEATDD